MSIDTFIERRLYVPGQKFWFTTMSTERPGMEAFDMGRWSNCLYINFFKEDFPALRYPGLVDGWREGQKIFNYNHCDIADLDWHGGITFYEEVICVGTGRTRVRAGCDFQHLYDDDWMRGDNGECILKNYTEGLTREFLDLVARRSTDTTHKESP